MKIAYIMKEEWEEAYIRERLPDDEVAFFAGTLQEHIAGVDAGTEALCVFVNSPVSAAEMERLPNLKLITTRSTGFDHIDTAEAARRGIAVASVPGYGVPTVAEFGFALLLALSRKVCEAHARFNSGDYTQEGLTGFDLMGKTIGVVGSGRIGAHMARIAKGFGMTVLVHDIYQNAALAKEIGFEYVALPALLAASDIISLHAPYTKETHHLINAESVKQIKKGAYLINTARGALVETAALVEALKTEVLAGAGLDVLEEEGDKAVLAQTLNDRYLTGHPRVIMTSHIAFDTAEAVRRILDTTVANIKAFESGTPQNVVKADK